MLKRYEKIQTGMDKDDVLNLLGSPKYSYRKNGQDRFGYVFYHDDQRYEREVHFTESKVIYSGIVPVGSPTAAEQDVANESSNKELDDSLRAKKDELKKDFKSYENSVRSEEETRYVPQFKPVN